jgi:cytosine/adenosine deaminase-related metal-dependent hydrolase
MTASTTVFTNARLPKIGLATLVVRGGKFASVEAGDHIPDDAEAIDLSGDLVLPGLVDGHMHLDKTLFGLPWMPHRADPNRMSRIETDKVILPTLPLPARERAALLLDRCIANGTSHVRTHVDVHREMGLTPLEEILAVRERYRGRITIQIVAFPQGGVIRAPGVLELLDEAISAGADLVGGIDPSEVDRDSRGQLDAIFGLADRRGVGVDIHLHEAGELGLYDLEEICARTKALGMQGRVTVSHGFCFGTVSESKQRAAAALMGELDMRLATHGGGGIVIPPVAMLRRAGVTVFAGNDDVRDTWLPYGNADMLQRAALIGWKSDFRTDEAVEVAFDVVSRAGAKALDIKGHGVAVGDTANFFAVGAECIAEAVGGYPPRKLVVHEGKIVAREGRALGGQQ